MDVPAAKSELEYEFNRHVLISKLPQGGMGAEVGTWKGDFSAQLLEYSKPKLLYLIDPWTYRGDPEYEHAMYGPESGGQADMDEIYGSVLIRFRTQTKSGSVVVWRKSSNEGARDLPDGSLDWVYIDGDHTYAAVKADLEAFRRVVKPRGVISGDDYDDDGWWADGVTKAVDEFADVVGRPEIIGNQFIFHLP
jgi:SAM-dependent methyltransferase